MRDRCRARSIPRSKVEQNRKLVITVVEKIALADGYFDAKKKIQLNRQPKIQS
jgi:hypothetical protein